MTNLWLQGIKKSFDEEEVLETYKYLHGICNSCLLGGIDSCGDQEMQDCPANIAKEALGDLVFLLKDRGAYKAIEIV